MPKIKLVFPGSGLDGSCSVLCLLSVRFRLCFCFGDLNRGIWSEMPRFNFKTSSLDEWEPSSTLWSFGWPVGWNRCVQEHLSLSDISAYCRASSALACLKPLFSWTVFSRWWIQRLLRRFISGREDKSLSEMKMWLLHKLWSEKQKQTTSCFITKTPWRRSSISSSWLSFLKELLLVDVALSQLVVDEGWSGVHLKHVLQQFDGLIQSVLEQTIVRNVFSPVGKTDQTYQKLVVVRRTFCVIPVCGGIWPGIWWPECCCVRPSAPSPPAYPPLLDFR